jgi:hypothetical protein
MKTKNKRKPEEKLKREPPIFGDNQNKIPHCWSLLPDSYKKYPSFYNR